MLGWDAVGVVKAVGSAVTLFAAGDEVWYAGALGRPGSNSEFQLVDERIVARKPRSAGQRLRRRATAHRHNRLGAAVPPPWRKGKAATRAKRC